MVMDHGYKVDTTHMLDVQKITRFSAIIVMDLGYKQVDTTHYSYGPSDTTVDTTPNRQLDEGHAG